MATGAKVPGNGTWIRPPMLDGCDPDLGMPIGGGLIKKSMRINEHRTSVALEVEFWAALREIAGAQGLTLPTLMAEIDAANEQSGQMRSLASAARVYALLNWRQPTGRANSASARNSTAAPSNCTSSPGW